MKVIGLCGGSGSGKGVVSALFAELGIPSIDTDAVYHELTSCDTECLRALADAFGKEIITENGSLNRRVLADIVFNSERSEENRALLNEISHRHILAETRNRLSRLEESGARAAIVDAPLLFESGFDRECNLIIAVTADEEARLCRIMRRDGITRERALERVRTQICDSELSRRADFVIVNDGDLANLRERVENIAEKIFES